VGPLTLEQASYVGELISAVVVVISVLYLAVQIKQNTRSIRTQAVYELSSLFAEHQTRLAYDKDFVDVYLRGVQDFDGLSPQEQVRFSLEVAALLRIFAEMHFQRCEYTIDENMWTGIASVIADLMSYTGYQSVWKKRRHQYNKEFQQYVDNLLQDTSLKKASLYPEGAE